MHAERTDGIACSRRHSGRGGISPADERDPIRATEISECYVTGDDPPPTIRNSIHVKVTTCTSVTLGTRSGTSAPNLRKLPLPSLPIDCPSIRRGGGGEGGYDRFLSIGFARNLSECPVQTERAQLQSLWPRSTKKPYPAPIVARLIFK